MWQMDFLGSDLKNILSDDCTTSRRAGGRADDGRTGGRTGAIVGRAGADAAAAGRGELGGGRAGAGRGRAGSGGSKPK